jgi:hypothetical protein
MHGSPGACHPGERVRAGSSGRPDLRCRSYERALAYPFVISRENTPAGVWSVQQKNPVQSSARAARVVLVNTLFWKIPVTRVNRINGAIWLAAKHLFIPGFIALSQQSKRAGSCPLKELTSSLPTGVSRRRTNFDALGRKADAYELGGRHGPALLIRADPPTSYRKLALIFSSIAEPGHSSASDSELSDASTVLKLRCRSSGTGST